MAVVLASRYIWQLWCQEQVSRSWMRNYSPQFFFQMLSITHTQVTSFWRQRPHTTQCHNYQAMIPDVSTFLCIIMNALYALYMCWINSNYGAADCKKQLFDCRVKYLIRVITSWVIDYLGIWKKLLEILFMIKSCISYGFMTVDENEALWHTQPVV